MSIDDNNNGPLDKIKCSVDMGHTLDSVGQNQEDDAQAQPKDPREALERELIKRLSAEKHRLAAELEIQFKEASIKRVQQHEKKFKEILSKEKQHLAEEKQLYEKALKDKYSRVMKSMLQERSAQLAAQINNKNSAVEIELRQQIEQLKQELSRQQQTASLQISEARITAKQEQEQASRALYDSIMQSNRDEIAKQAEAKAKAEFAQREIELKREHEINLKKHTAKLMTAYEEKLREALFDQEQAFTRGNTEQLTRQSELFNHRIKQEVDAAVAAATSALELEFVKEKQALNAIIESLRPEVEANRLRMRVEVEKEVREEFDLKFAQYKVKLDQTKQVELEALVTEQKQKIAEAMQEENMVVLKYKEREIREQCFAEYEQQLQSNIQKNLQQQEARLRAEHEQELASISKKIAEDHALQLQAEVIQERARVSEKSTNEKKILLQQQQANLQEQFQSELAHKLAMQAQELNQQHQIAVRDLELKLQQAQSQQRQQEYAATSLRVPAIIAPSAAPSVMEPDPVPRPAPRLQLGINLNEPHLVSAPPTTDPQIIEAEKRAALQAQERTLRAQFEQQMMAARAEWERAQQNVATHTQEEIVQATEQRLRREFQAILDQQRLQAASNFAKQRDVELRGTIARYKQKLLNEMETARVNDLAAAEEALKQQYAERMQQHAELAKVEVERTKEKLLEEQAEKIQAAVELQIAAVRKQQDLKFALYAEEQDKKLHALLDEEKKQLHLKFAQDKANLIKELTAKFTREKHIAMNKYETELREKLYREMVKQKDFIQTKFTQAQDAALNDQKRRLEAQHKQEIERIKQGFFDPNDERSKHDTVIAERSVEQLADRILAKFQKDTSGS